MKKFSILIVLICICIGFSGCALFVPVYECMTEPYPTTKTYYYYDGCYHTTPPPNYHTHYRTCHHYHQHRPHKSKVIYIHSHNRNRPNSNGGHRGSHYGRGGQQGGRHKR